MATTYRIPMILAVASFLAVPALAQSRTVVTVRGDTKADEYSYAPATVTVKRGDALVFKVTGNADHAVAFERNIPAAAKNALNAAMPGRVGDLSGPLIKPGREYVILIPRDMPVGRYRFFCLPHRAYDEAGWLEVR